MKILNLITGVVRPTAERVVKNIINTQNFFKNENITHYALTYNSEEANKLKQLIKENNIDIKIFFIDVFTDKHIKDLDKMCQNRGNCYRMFKSIEILINKVENFSSYDCVIRMRIDNEIVKLEIPTNCENNTWYTPKMDWTNPIHGGTYFDNFGLGNPEVFKKIFNTNYNYFKNMTSNHELIYKIMQHNKFTRKDINFKILMYQDNRDYVLGVKQWSKRNRCHVYENKWVSCM